MRTLTISLALALSSLAAMAGTLNGFALDQALVPEGEIMRGGPPRDGIPAIDDPKFVGANRAGFLDPRDRVIGVALDGLARAYPISILNWHEVVNDRFGERPIVVTYCPLCGTGMVFSAEVAGRALRFGVSGLLYQSDVLLYDRDTESLWSQLMEQAVSGPYKGQRLQPIAAEHTTWADWRGRHPQTVVLSADSGFVRNYARDPYAGYARSERLMFPVRHSDARLHPKEQVLGVSLGGRHKAYPFSALEKHAAVLDEQFGGQSVRIHFDARHRSARASAADGTTLPAVTAYWFAWYAFHPDTEVFEAAR